jgi:acyl-CoA thioester hydrolase
MSFRFTAAVPLRWVDIDSWGVLNNAVYLTLVEQARYQYFAAQGLLDQGQVGFVLAKATLHFLRPGRMGDAIVVAARVSRLGNSSFDMDYEVRAGDTVLATVAAVLVYTDAAVQPQRIPDRVRAALAAFEGIAAG